MDDTEAFSNYICPLMSSFEGIKHCSYHCIFYNSENKNCVINQYIRSKIQDQEKEKTPEKKE